MPGPAGFHHAVRSEQPSVVPDLMEAARKNKTAIGEGGKSKVASSKAQPQESPTATVVSTHERCNGFRSGVCCSEECKRWSTSIFKPLSRPGAVGISAFARSHRSQPIAVSAHQHPPTEF